MKAQSQAVVDCRMVKELEAGRHAGAATARAERAGWFSPAPALDQRPAPYARRPPTQRAFARFVAAAQKKPTSPVRREFPNDRSEPGRWSGG